MNENYFESSKKRRSFKVWLRDYLNKRINRKERGIISAVAEPTSYAGQQKFNKDFDGWTIRLHRAVDGHIVEAWKSYGDGPRPHNFRPEHELFMVRGNEDMSEALNSILVQLMLRG